MVGTVVRGCCGWSEKVDDAGNDARDLRINKEQVGCQVIRSDVKRIGMRKWTRMIKPSTAKKRSD
jgi:hypothetical protein